MRLLPLLSLGQACCASRNDIYIHPHTVFLWIPACAGMTEKNAGMTVFNSPFHDNVLDLNFAP
jgi:hypothetical protein